MKKLSCILLCVLILASLAACSGGGGAKKPDFTIREINFGGVEPENILIEKSFTFLVLCDDKTTAVKVYDRTAQDTDSPETLLTSSDTAIDMGAEGTTAFELTLTLAAAGDQKIAVVPEGEGGAGEPYPVTLTGKTAETLTAPGLNYTVPEALQGVYSPYRSEIGDSNYFAAGYDYTDTIIQVAASKIGTASYSEYWPSIEQYVDGLDVRDVTVAGIPGKCYAGDYGSHYFTEIYVFETETWSYSIRYDTGEDVTHPHYDEFEALVNSAAQR